jgi:hypothetical protein
MTRTHRDGRSWRTRTAAVALTVMAGAVASGCGEKASDAPISGGNLADVCQRSTYFTRAPAAAASPPRPIQVFEQLVGGGYMRSLLYQAQAGDAWNPRDAARTQLVACANRADEGRKVKECAFQTGRVALHEASYDVTVYETRTREERAVVTIQANGYACPMSAFFRGGEDRKLFARPMPEQYVTALRDQVEG